MKNIYITQWVIFIELINQSIKFSYLFFIRKDTS